MTVTKTSYHRIGAALATIAALATVSISGVATAQTSAGPTEKQCRVDIDRSGAVSTYAVVRQEFNNGRCICAVTTGPETQGGSIETQIAALLKSRTCEDAPSVAMGQGSGLNPAGVGAGLGGAALFGLAIANASSERASP
jgi:hypothetical protein